MLASASTRAVLSTFIFNFSLGGRSFSSDIKDPPIRGSGASAPEESFLSLLRYLIASLLLYFLSPFNSSNLCNPDLLIAYATAHAIAPATHPITNNNTNDGSTVKFADWIGGTCWCEGGTDNWIALAFSIAITTATKITVISTGVAFGNRNSVRMRILLIGNSSHEYKPVAARTCSCAAPRNSPPISRPFDIHRAIAPRVAISFCRSRNTALISLPNSSRCAAGYRYSK